MWLQDAPHADFKNTPKGQRERESANDLWPATAETAERELLRPELPPARQRQLRIHAWHLRNDTYRRGQATEQRPAMDTPFDRTNMLALLPLLDESDQGERLLKAELWRELGEPEKSLALLEWEYDRDYQSAANQLKALTRAGLRQVKAFDFA